MCTTFVCTCRTVNVYKNFRTNKKIKDPPLKIFLLFVFIILYINFSFIYTFHWRYKMKEKKNKRIEFRTTLLVWEEARLLHYSYEEVFLVGLRCLRDDNSRALLRAHELIEELRVLNLELKEQELLKEKIRRKTDELKSLNKKLEYVGDACDVIKYNRNKKLGIVIGGLSDRYYSSGASVEDFIKKNDVCIQEAAVNNNLDMNLIIEEFKKKIRSDKND